MKSLNIINLIEKNPITNIFNNKLLIKIKENFTELQQQLLMVSYYCYLNYNENTAFVIDLDDIWKWLGFSQKELAIDFLEKEFIANSDYKIYYVKNIEEEKYDDKNKKSMMLNIKTFKLFCNDFKKEIELNKYFVKLEYLLFKIIEENDELKLQVEELQLEKLQVQLEELVLTQKKNTAVEFSKEIQYAKHNFLLVEFLSQCNIIYIIKIKSYYDDDYIIKIGKSICGIEIIFNECKLKYDEALLLDCFIVNKNKDFEYFLHNHENIKNNQVTDLEGYEDDKRLFLIGDNLSYCMLLDIINTNINLYN